MENYYELLGVSRKSDENEIKTAYKKLARKYHPDKTSGDEKAEVMFKNINEAYETLSDKKKRRSYDINMSSSFDFTRWDQAFNSRRSNATDFNSTIKPEPPKGNDLKATVPVTLEEIYNGCKKTIKIKKWKRCPTCDGTGAKTTKACHNCRGVGSVRRVIKSSMFGQSLTIDTCKRCYGSGVEIDKPCMYCKGESRIREESTIRVKIPKLVNVKNFIILNGEGDAGKHSGPSGNIQIGIEEIPHEKFRREGDDLYTEIEVSITDLVLGTKLKIPTLSGDNVDIKIPPGHSPYVYLSIKGKGLDEESNLYVVPKLTLPVNLGDRERKLFEELREIENIIMI